METRTSTLRRYIDFFALRSFVIKELPTRNELIEAHKACPITLAHNVSALVNKLLPIVPELINETNPNHLKWEKHLLVLLSFATTSIERHFQTFKIPLSIWDILPVGTEELMIQLGNLLQVPPRDSSYTTWLYNRNCRYKLDNSFAWQLFHKGVVIYDDNCISNNVQLRLITKKHISISSNKASHIFENVSKNIDAIFNVWRTFMAKNADGEPNISPEYFMFVFRTYFLTYRIGGIEYTGSNAANIASGISFDVITGICDIYYREIVLPNRLQHFTLKDQEQIYRDLNTCNIFELFLEELGLNEGMLEHMMAEDLKRIYIAPSAELTETFKAFYKVVDKWGALFSMHLGMINNYLTKPSIKYAGGCPLGFNAPIVDPTKGTGLMDHNETKRLADMRRTNGRLKVLKELFNLK